MKITRRDVGIALGAGLMAALFTTGTGLTVYKFRKSAWATPEVRRVGDGGWVLLEEDRDRLGAADALIEAPGFELKPSIDFMGGDITAIETNGLGECIEACGADNNCRAFTYAKSNHVLPEKRMKCWLKDSVGEARSDISYVSGVAS